jgi:integrase
MFGPSEIRERIQGDKDPMRRAIAYLSYAGLGAGEIHRLGWNSMQAQSVRLPRPSDSHGLGISYDQARALLSSVEEAGNLRDQIIVEAGLACGLRQIELRRLLIVDIQRRNGRMFLSVKGKGGGRRVVYVPRPLQERITRLVTSGERYLKRTKTVGGSHPSRPLFQSYTGGPLSECGMRRIINRHLKKVAPDATAHGLRHTCVTWLLNSGATLEQAMEIAGHTEAGSHELYAAAGGDWFVGAWRKAHPIAQWGVGVGYAHVAGREYTRRMSRGTERVVPVPTEIVSAVLAGFHEGGLPRDTVSKKMMAWIFSDLDYDPSMLRKAGAIHMAEAGAHPFLISLVLGVTPGYVVDSKFDRMGPKAEEERVDAIERACERLYEAENVDLELRSA